MESIIVENRNRFMIYIVKIDDDYNVYSIYSKYLKCYFENKRYVCDYQRYIEVNQNELNQIGYDLIETNDMYNEIYDILSEIKQKHLDKHYDDKGMLKNKYYHYSVIAYRCMENYKKVTENDINLLLGVYANKL